MAGELVEATLEIFYDGAWNDHSNKMYNRNPVRITRGIANEGGRADPGSCQFTINNRDGEFSPRNPRSSLFGKIGRNTPVRISAGLEGGAQSIRFVGEVVQWPQRWDASGRDVYVPVQAAGIMRRLGIPGKPLRSAMRRYIPGTSPVAYWPLDDGPSAGFARPASGTARLVPNSPSFDPHQDASVLWQGGRAAPWLEQTARLERRQERSFGIFYDDLRSDAINADPDEAITVDLIYRRADSENSRLLLRLISDDDDDTVWVAVRAGVVDTDEDPSTVGLAVEWNAATPTTSWSATELPAALDRETHHLRFEATPNGSDTDMRVWWDGTEISFTTATGSGVRRGNSYRLLLMWWAGPSETLGLPTPGSHDVSDLAVWHGSAPAISDVAEVAFGHAGETAGRRVERLCDEEDVALTTAGDLDETTPMGAQHPRQFMALLDEAADAEAAGSKLPILVEQRDALGLHFNARSSFYLS